MDKTLGIDFLKGKFHNSSFDVAGKILLAENKEPEVSLKGQINFDLKDLPAVAPALQKTLEPFQPVGVISWDGNFQGTPSDDWRNWEMKFNAQSPQIIIAGYTIKDISLKALEANQWIKHFDLTADIYDGKLETEGVLSLADQAMPFQINVNLPFWNILCAMPASL